MNGSRTLKVDSDKAIKEILMNRGGKVKTVEVSVCDFTNWIRHTFYVPDCKIGDDLLKDKLKEIGLKQCLRRDASMYALWNIETNNKTWWLCSI